MTTLEERRSHRLQFLKALYDATDGNEFKVVNIWDIGKKLKWDDETVNVTAQYLVGEGLLQYLTLGGGLVITHFGVEQVENAIANPEQETKYFPPIINLIQVHRTNSEVARSQTEGAKFQIFEDQKGEYRWRLLAANNEVIAASVEGYKSKSACIDGIKLTRKLAQAGKIE
jgi:uncharacterized protein YegP (UPF0339 family)